MVIQNISGYFLMICLFIVMFLMYMILMPFLPSLFLAAVVVTITYPIYEWLVKKLWNREGLASIVMCLMVVLLLVLPFVQLTLVFAGKSVDAYRGFEQLMGQGFLDNISIDKYLDKLTSLQSNLPISIDMSWDKIQSQILAFASKLNSLILGWTTAIIAGTANLVIKFFFFLFSMYYLFKDGKKFLKKSMYLSPLANKYDRIIFEKFREMSISTVLSTFAVAVAQGIVSAIGYMIVGVPAFFLAVATSLCGLIPMVGATIVWMPTGIVLLVMGKWWQGLFILIYGVLAISLVDNFIRPFLIEGRTKVHPLLIFFSIIGGIAYLGPMGFLFGPLILSVFLTFIHIYSIEYRKVLEE